MACMQVFDSVESVGDPVIVKEIMIICMSNNFLCFSTGIIMGTFVACWVPFFTWYMLSALIQFTSPEWLVQTMFWIGYFNSTLNPIIYAYFNRDFRDAFKETIQCVFLFPRKNNTQSYV